VEVVLRICLSVSKSEAITEQAAHLFLYGFNRYFSIKQVGFIGILVQKKWVL
jgi:hypothetical protein